VKYQVDWVPQALQTLAGIWVRATDRNAVTAASHAIDQTLADDADAVGRAVFDTVREYHHPPLGVEFDVIVADAQVWVLTVWETATGRPPATGN
jgi:hypothetical protein